MDKVRSLVSPQAHTIQYCLLRRLVSEKRYGSVSLQVRNFRYGFLSSAATDRREVLQDGTFTSWVRLFAFSGRYFQGP